MNAAKRQRLLVVCLVAGMFAAPPVIADNGGGFRRSADGDGRQDSGEHFRQLGPDPRQSRRELRRGGGAADAAGIDRRDAWRERWPQSPAGGQKSVEQRRQARQLSPEERLQLRRDILEANRGSRDDRGR